MHPAKIFLSKMKLNQIGLNTTTYNNYTIILKAVVPYVNKVNLKRYLTLSIWYPTQNIDGEKFWEYGCRTNGTARFKNCKQLL